MATREMHVVVEYPWKAYGPPADWWDATKVSECRVTHVDGALQVEGQTLAEIRDVLENAGFAQQELVQPVKTHRARRWEPTWREVWARREEIEENVSMSWLSPEAEKAQREAAGRRRGWWPWLQRTESKAIVQRPWLGGRRRQRAFADWMRANLPAFTFDTRRNYWAAPLEELARAYEVLSPDGVNVSDGARAYLERHERDRALPVDHRRGRSVLFKS